MTEREVLCRRTEEEVEKRGNWEESAERKLRTPTTREKKKLAAIWVLSKERNFHARAISAPKGKTLFGSQFR